ncbi:MAG: hypothetical protein Tp178MES00d2C33159851_101 [Prokaryotic dsDNA virus sp.]|nr:MAG: hypothetical protein Tp178MES00d2C33159851_101 [Prokaryotic dsDNA virus sp.]|tara:strand:+ start:40031 stop:40432 length:402 start_codon:yes stop_codon:yes gene_type:complete
MNYFSQTRQALYNDALFDVEDMPPDVVPLDEDAYSKVITALNSGKQVSVTEGGKFKYKQADLKNDKASEVWWVKTELQRVSEELDKIADGYHTTTVKEQDWRAYRNELRDWPLHESYPQYKHRPTSPEQNKEV